MKFLARLQIALAGAMFGAFFLHLVSAFDAGLVLPFELLLVLLFIGVIIYEWLMKAKP